MNKHLFITLFALCLLTPFSSTRAQDAGDAYINFQENEAWETARSVSAEEGKYLMVDAYTDWCGWCKVQDKETFHNPKVAEFMNQHFVSVKIDFERGVGIALAMKHRVRSYPTLLFFTPEGKLAGRIIGYEKDIDRFLEQVEGMRNTENHPPQIGDPNVLDPGFPDFYKDAFGKGRKYPEAETVVAWLNEQEDIYAEAYWNVMTMMPLTEEFQGNFLKNYEGYQERFGKKEASKVIDNIVNSYYRQAMVEKDEVKLKATLKMKQEYSPDPVSEAYMKVNFYQHIEDWQRVAQSLEQAMAELEADKTHGMINSIAWGIYEKCEDAEIVGRAADWMNKVVQSHGEYMYLDTYAALLYKKGDYKTAHKWAEIAIQVGKENGEKVTETEALLEKIESTLKK